MADNENERTYKHQVPAEVFVEAVTNTELKGNAEKRKLFNTKYNKYGINRFTGTELNLMQGLNQVFYFNKYHEFTLLDNAEIEGKVIFNNFPSLFPHIIIYKSETQDFIINNCQLAEINFETKKTGEGVNFYILDSRTDDFRISQSTTGNFHIWNNCSLADFDIYESTTGDFSIKNKCTIGVFQIWCNCTLGEFKIHDSKTGNFYISDNCTIGDFNIWDNCIMRDFNISQSTTGSFRISESTTSNFQILNNSKTGDFILEEIQSGRFKVDNAQIGQFILNNSKTGYITFENSQTGYLSIDKNCDTGLIHASDSSSPQWNIHNLFVPFSFHKANIGQCKLTNCDITELRVENDCEMELYINGGTILHANFEQTTLGKKCVITISGVNIYAFNIKDFAMLGNLYLREIGKMLKPICFFDRQGKRPKYDDKIVWKNYFHKLTNYAEKNKLLIEKGNINEPTFRISQSSLGKTEFTECDLAGFNFEFNNSKITEVFISGGSVPDTISVPDETNRIKVLEQEKSFFDQLKKVFEGQGDVARGVFYHAKAAQIQMKIAWKEKKLFELLVHGFNLISNNHGRHWHVALLFILVVSMGGFYLYNNYLIPAKYEFNWHYSDFWGDWAQFILPTHRTDFMVANPNSSAIFIDIMFRILIGYGIYQFISAFRKHGKRG